MFTTMKNKTIIHGAFQNENFGDILLVETLVDKLGLDKDELLLSNSCDYVSVTLGIRKASFLNKLLCKRYLFCGGGYLGERKKNLFKWYVQFYLNHMSTFIICFLFAKSYVIYGVGFGPINNIFTRFVLYYFLKGSKGNYLRDAESVSYFKKYFQNLSNVVQTYDLVLSHNDSFYINKYNLVKAEPSKHTIVIHLPGKKENFAIRSDIISRITEKFDDSKFVFLSDNSINSYPDYFDCSKTDFMYIYKDQRSVLNTLFNADIIFTSKLHVGIFSALFSKLPVSIYAHPKTKRFYDQIDRNNLCFELDCFDFDAFDSFLDEIYNNNVSCISLNKYFHQVSKIHSREINEILY